MTELQYIREVIVVEGAHDRDRVLQAVDADVVVTGGSRIARDVFDRLGRVADSRGIIILTDPDYAGEQIRRKIAARFPTSKHAFIPRANATANGDIGVENACAQDILQALQSVRTLCAKPEPRFIWTDMLDHGLAGSAHAASRRMQLGALLGIGYGNAKTFFQRLNALQVSRDEFATAVAELDVEVDR